MQSTLQVSSAIPRQEGNVLCLRADGKGQKTVADILNISESAVKKATNRLFKKYGVRKMPAVVAEAFRRGHLRYAEQVDDAIKTTFGLLLCFCMAFGPSDQAQRVRTQRPQITTVRARELS